MARTAVYGALTGFGEYEGVETTEEERPMPRIFELSRITLVGYDSSLFRQVLQARRIAKANRHLETLPRDRLNDMGIAPHTQANQRHSGQTGPVPRPILW